MTGNLRPICRFVLVFLALGSAVFGFGDINSLAVSPDGGLLAVGADEISVLDAGTLEVRWRPAESPGQARGVAFSPDGQLLAAACRNGMVRIYRGPDWAEAAAFKAHKKAVNAVCFSPDGDRFATGSSDKTVRIWDTASQKELSCLNDCSRAVHAVTFSPDGVSLAGASADGKARLWRISDSACVQTFSGHNSSIWSLCFDSKGRYIATGSRDTTVKVWDTKTGSCVRTFSGHTSVVRSVVFSPDGIHLASGAWDRTIRIWDVVSGTLVTEFRGPRQPIRALAFGPYGKVLYSGTAYDTPAVQAWRDNVPFSDQNGEIVLEAEPESRGEPTQMAPMAITPGNAEAWPDGTHGRETAKAIQEALNIAMGVSCEERRIVELPPGNYLVTEPLTMSNITLCGQGAVLHMRNETDTYFFGLTLGTGAKLTNVKVVGEGAKCVPVRLGNPAMDVIVRDVHIQEGTILLNGQVTCNNINIDSCLFEDGGYGLLLDRPSKGRNVRVTNCTFRNNRSDAIELNFPWEERGNLVEDIVIANCVFEGTGPDPDSGTAGFAIGMAGARDVQITGNTFRDSAVQAIHIEDNSENVTITGNNMINCGVDHTGGNWTGGVHILSGSRYITVSGNNISNCRFGVSGLQGGTLRWCTITGNTFRNCEIGVRIMQFPHGIIQGNLFDDCQTSINIWRTPYWSVIGNQIASSRHGAVGAQITQFRNLLMTGNTIRADIAIEHREAHGDRDSLVEQNLVIESEKP